MVIQSVLLLIYCIVTNADYHHVTPNRNLHSCCAHNDWVLNFNRYHTGIIPILCTADIMSSYLLDCIHSGASLPDLIFSVIYIIIVALYAPRDVLQNPCTTFFNAVLRACVYLILGGRTVVEHYSCEYYFVRS